jgi:hypothetical protein
MLSIHRKINKGAIVLSISLFVSCNLADPLVSEVHETDFINKTGEVINGNILNLEVPGAQTIAVYDTLMLFTTNNPAGLLQVYNTKTLKPIAMLCQQGRARNEFANSSIYKSDQFYLRNNDLIIVLRGEGGSVLKEINVSQSIKKGHTVVEGINNLVLNSNETVVGLDNNIDRLFVFNNHNYSIDQGDYNPPLFSVRDKDEDDDKNIKVYRRLVDFENDRYATFWYAGSIIKHPTKNIVVQCMQTLDYIHYFNLDNGKHFAVHQAESPTFDNIKVPNNVVDEIYYYDYNHFSEAIGTEKFLLVMYMNGEYRKESIKKGNREATELLAFDWDGNYLGGVKLDLFVQDLAFEPKTNLLYGLRIRDEKIVTFDLSDFVKSIDK